MLCALKDPMSPATSPPETTADESRASRRFVSRSGWQGSFAATPVAVIDISESGLQVEHSDAIAIGKEGQVSLAIKPGHNIAVSARVVWSRFGKGAAGNQKIYRSGLVFTPGRGGISEDVLELLVRANVVQFDDESLKKKQLARALRAQRRTGGSSVPATTPRATISTGGEALELARKARQYLRNNPEEANKWNNRARYAAHRTRGADRIPLEQLAVWEFLERKIDIEIVRLAFQIR